MPEPHGGQGTEGERPLGVLQARYLLSYEVISVLGDAITYLARDMTLGREVAITASRSAASRRFQSDGPAGG